MKSINHARNAAGIRTVGEAVMAARAGATQIKIVTGSDAGQEP